MSRNPNYKHGGQKPRNQTQDSKPRLTHFLCLPLVNAASAPQLVTSLEEFKSSIPLVFDTAAAGAGVVRTPLVPDAAHRPLGTLHLTLGVMSLPTREKLDEALNLLQSIDIVSMMREAEAEAQTKTTLPPSQGMGHSGDTTTNAPLPLTVNLTSLHALPNARSATVLHAAPVDSTSRLYPFCVALRNKFIEAGFIHQEMIKAPRSKRGFGSGPSTTAMAADDAQDHSDDGGVDLRAARTAGETSQGQETEGKIPRPLLLHATISNTVYAGKRWSKGAGGGDSRGKGKAKGGNNQKRKEVLKFDATELLSRFGDQPAAETAGQAQTGLARKAVPRNMPFQTEEEGPVSTEGQRREKATPFVWARDIPLDRLCICEMGAKPVPYDESKGGPRLGEEYTVVGERSLDFAR